MSHIDLQYYRQKMAHPAISKGGHGQTFAHGLTALHFFTKMIITANNYLMQGQ